MLKIIEKTGIITAVLLSILQFVGYFINTNIPIETLIISFFAFPLRWSYLTKMSDISKNFTRYFFWLSWDLAMIALPIFSFDAYASTVFSAIDGSSTYIYNTSDVSFCIFMGISALVLFFLSSIWWVNKTEQNMDYFPTLSKQQVVMASIMITIVIFVGSSFSKFFNIGTWGGIGAVYLPFKLAGIINYFTYGFLGFAELFLLDAMLKKGFNLWVPTIFIVLISICITYVTLSKGNLIVPVSLMLMYLIYTKRINVKNATAMGLLLLIAFVTASFLSAYRSSRSEIHTKGFGAEGASYSAMMFTHRIFSEGITLMKFHAVMPHSELQEELKNCNYNPNTLQTVVIDRTPETINSSSGCTPLAGGYAFGYWGFALVSIIFGLGSTFIDYIMPKAKGILSAPALRVYVAFFWCFTCRALLINIIAMFFAGQLTQVLFFLFTLFFYVIYLKWYCKKQYIQQPTAIRIW